jgi:3'-phosphoadenosine 5'-phosphosulfate sulfotransferase (PAPS reductase)/FAD synthetase
MMLEKGMQVDEVVFCDTTVEFPAMLKHIDQVEKYIGIKITRLKAEHNFEYYLGHHVKTKGKNKGKVGYGWAGPKLRWCTSMLKTDIIKKYLKNIIPRIEYIGIAYDEPKRVNKSKSTEQIKYNYPLYDWGITEKNALAYCYSKGFNWGGLYEKFDRVSCFLCPLQPLRELKKIYNDFPELWAEMKRLDKLSYRTFRADYSLDQLEARFKAENEQPLISWGDLR